MTIRIVLAIILSSTSNIAMSKTAQEIFNIASKSVVLIKVTDERSTPVATGSGVVVNKGEVVTNCHVLTAGSDYEIKRGNETSKATVKYADIDKDLCLLVSTTLNAPPISRGEASKLKIGDVVYAVGAPRGLELSLSDGIVSQLRDDKDAPLIQTTVPISPGSSGGGLFDSNARLVGITTSYLKDSQNINFAIPVEWISKLKSDKYLTLNGLSTSKNMRESSPSQIKPDGSNADVFRFVADMDGKAKLYLRRDNIQVVDNKVVATTIINMNVPTYNQMMDFTFQTLSMKQSYDCRSGASALLVVDHYSGLFETGKLLYRLKVPSDEVEYIVINKPIDISAHKAVCEFIK